MHQPLITVIVPVYKTEEYLRRCVDSIVNQTYKNLEIILVDDGSPDNSGKLCDELAKTDSRIKVIHKQNGGLSSARNAGLDIMTGDYVAFVDSDDFIELNMYESLLRLLISTNSQIAESGIVCDYPNGEHHYFNPDFPASSNNAVFSKIEALKEIMLAKKITNSACDKLFKAAIFENLRFTEGIILEDFDLMPRCIEKASSVCYTPQPFYHYVMTEQSIMRGGFRENRFTETDISRRYIEYYFENYPEIADYALAKHIMLCLVLIHASSQDNRFKEKREQLIKEVKNSDFGKVFKLLDKKTKIKYLFAKTSIRLFVILMDIWNKNK